MLQGMSVANEAANLLTTTAERSASHAEPQVFFQVTLLAMCKSCFRQISTTSKMVSSDWPEEGIGPLAICCRVRVCSHATISSSQDFTTDWRAEDMDCMTPSTRAFNVESVEIPDSSRP